MFFYKIVGPSSSRNVVVHNGVKLFMKSDIIFLHLQASLYFLVIILKVMCLK